MSAAPSASNSDKTFTSTPADNLSRGTNYKLQITTSAKDTSSNSLADNYTTTNGFTTYGTGTIKGTVRYDNSTGADNVSVSFAKSGTTVGNTTTADNGTYSQDNLSLGGYTLTFTKSNYNDASLSATLATDNQTVTANVTLLSNDCSAGTVTGTITDAVSGNAVSGVSLSVRSGLSVTSGSTTGITATTATNGTYTLLEADGAASSMSAGGYTVQVSKSGYITSFITVNLCNNMINQNANISESLNPESLRIVVHWAANRGVVVLDSHITGPDNTSGRFHIYWNASTALTRYQDPDNYYYYTDAYQCNSCTAAQASDNVTLDRDDMDGAPGTETITITKIRSGTYRYSVQDYSNRNNASSRILADSGTTVTAYYNNTEIPFSLPNSAGNLWVVFTFNGDTRVFTAQDNMTSHADYDTIQ
jgi:hypothetical protein